MKKKLETLSCLSHVDFLSEAPEIDAKVIDGAAIINMLKPTYGKIFHDHAINTFVPNISSLLRPVEYTSMMHMR